MSWFAERRIAQDAGGWPRGMAMFTKLMLSLAVVLVLALPLAILGLGVGVDGWQAPWHAWADVGQRAIVLDIRAPRSIGAFLVGALLGLGGAVAQGLFRNPLAEPYLLGSASGAGLSMALALAAGPVLWHGAELASGQSLAFRFGLTAISFLGAWGGVMLTLVLARGAAHTMRLLLAGVVVGVVLGALTQWLMLWSAEAWRSMQAFLLGNTALLGWPACVLLGCALVITLPLALAMSPVLDALALGEDAARSLGVPLGLARGVLVFVLAASTAAAVAQAGLVAFVGLVAPHLARGFSGGRYHMLLWSASLVGGVLLLLSDVLARGLLPPQELPVGVLTAVLGGGYLLLLLHRRRA
jgi:iron complex transport system permease protein